MDRQPAGEGAVRSGWPLKVGVALVTFVVMVAVPRAAIASHDGNWGGAVGLLIAPYVWYAVIQYGLTLVVRRLAGSRETRFATSRLNYLTAALVSSGALGSLARSLGTA